MMMLGKALPLVIGVLLFAFACVPAAADEGEAGTELDFMNLGAGARPAGLGGSFAPVADDANAVYWNVAGMSLVNSPQVTGMHTDLDLGTTFDYVAAAAPLTNPLKQPRGLSRHSIGLSLVRASTGNILLTEEGTDTLPGGQYREIIYKGTADFKAGTYSLAYALRITSAVSAGISAKMIDMSLVDHTGTGYGVDFGFLYRPLERRRWLDDFSVGLSAQDVSTTQIKWSTGYTEKISPNVRFGAAYRLLAGGTITDWIPEDGILLAASLDQQIKGERQQKWHKAQYHAGIEWKLMGMVPVRAGYDFGQFTSGIGFVSEHLNVDYAYVSHEELKTTHRVAVTLKM